jgi:peptidyl-dipeptidase A
MVRFADRFFTSLGFDPMPASFWQRSQFVRPADREVVCHPSAWDIDGDLDLRIKMCIEITKEDFNTVHHELGHNIYQRAYRHQPYLFREGANDGFHEAIGDAVALSLTPSYLVRAGLLDREPDAHGDLPLLLRTALERVPLLPFAMAVDTWRWQVFAGQITPATYNAAWWDLVARYQRVAPPEARSEAHFDAASKYHVANNVPYAPYFLAFILQFQFHRAFARQAGYTGPLHRFSVYGDAAAGKRLGEMLAMGRSRPWADALEALTGEREMDATAVLEYFAPLQEWLDEQNAGTGPAD